MYHPRRSVDRSVGSGRRWQQTKTRRQKRQMHDDREERSLLARSKNSASFARYIRNPCSRCGMKIISQPGRQSALSKVTVASSSPRVFFRIVHCSVCVVFPSTKGYMRRRNGNVDRPAGSIRKRETRRGEIVWAVRSYTAALL